MSTNHSSPESAAMDDMRDPQVASALRAEQAHQPTSPVTEPPVQQITKQALQQPTENTEGSARWYAVDEIGNDNFATSIYEAGHKGLLVARCNQNGQYPWQAPAIIRGLEKNKAVAVTRPDGGRTTVWPTGTGNTPQDVQLTTIENTEGGA